MSLIKQLIVLSVNEWGLGPLVEPNSPISTRRFSGLSNAVVVVVVVVSYEALLIEQQY